MSNNIQTIAQLDLADAGDASVPKKVKEIFSAPRRSIIEIKLNSGAVLGKHKAAEPITVLCLGGRGTFSAGPELGEAVAMTAGTLISLEANVDHQVVAEAEIHLLVTKFRPV